MSPFPVYKALEIESVFRALKKRERFYAHHMSRAAWLGTRIILRQVSPESNDIFDLIVELSRSCQGKWMSLLPGTIPPDNTAKHDLQEFLQYAALFPSNLGNYYGQGDQKFVPKVSEKFVMGLALKSESAARLAKRCVNRMLDPQPANLGYPSPITQSAYYLSSVSKNEVQTLSKFILKHGIALENTRLLKTKNAEDEPELRILQASIEQDDFPKDLGTISDLGSVPVKVVRGDHARDLGRVSSALSEAAQYCASDIQAKIIACLQETFRTGNIEDNKAALKSWVKDADPVVDHVLGFVEYLVESSQEFIKTLPWVEAASNEKGNGPFETELFEPPSFTSLHALSYASSFIFLGITLPNFEDIKQDVGLKNFMIANRETSLPPEELEKASNAPFVADAERTEFLRLMHSSVRQKIVIHELFGHGTGKLRREDNFDTRKPPTNPLTGEPIDSWYRKGEGYYDVFGDIAGAMEECRAECVGVDLICDKRLLAMFGYDGHSPITADQLIYNAYLHLGVLGLEALLSYSPENMTWGQAHDQGHFAMMRVLLLADGFMNLDVDFETHQITVTIDQSKLLSRAKQSLRQLLLKIHICRCTAVVDAARTFFGGLTEVNEYWLKIRDIVATHKPRKEVFVQANTYEEDGDVGIKEYELSAEGCIQSWTERCELLDL